MEKKAGYQISTSMNDGILEIIFTGKITGLDVSQLQKEISSLRATVSDRLMMDLRTLDESIGYADVLYYVRRPEKEKGKTAVIDWPENEQVKSFCDTVALNTSLQVKWFSNIDAARNWLKETGKRAVAFDY